MNSTVENHDSTINLKLAGGVILALLLVFVLQKMGFRFVVSAGVGTR